jgi:beta-glucanase (GH16 family)
VLIHALLNQVTGQEWVLFTRSKLNIALLGVMGLTACGGGGGGSVAPASLELTLPATYALKWSDDFSTPGRPSSTWSYDLGSPLLGGTVWGNAEKQYYTDQAKNSFIDANGQLVIQPVAGVAEADMSNGDSSSVPDVLTSIQARNVSVTSALNTTPYGFYEIRAKVPCVAGAWPAIWMMGKDGIWPARGEIDIMEWFGGLSEFIAQPNQVQSGVHSTANHWAPPKAPLYAKKSVANMCTEFHKFQLHWSANEILMGVDGVPTFSFKKPANATTDNWPFSQPAYVLLNVAVGGNLGGAFNVNSLPSMNMQVDYVKVWQPPS